MKAVHTSETLVYSNETTRRYIAEGFIIFTEAVDSISCSVQMEMFSLSLTEAQNTSTRTSDAYDRWDVNTGITEVVLQGFGLAQSV
jgi:hypothetical protein